MPSGEKRPDGASEWTAWQESWTRMPCCGCGLVHEVQVRVKRTQSVDWPQWRVRSYHKPQRDRERALADRRRFEEFVR